MAFPIAAVVAVVAIVAVVAVVAVSVIQTSDHPIKHYIRQVITREFPPRFLDHLSIRKAHLLVPGINVVTKGGTCTRADVRDDLPSKIRKAGQDMLHSGSMKLGK